MTEFSHDSALRISAVVQEVERRVRADPSGRSPWSGHESPYLYGRLNTALQAGPDSYVSMDVYVVRKNDADELEWQSAGWQIDEVYASALMGSTDVFPSSLWVEIGRRNGRWTVTGAACS